MKTVFQVADYYLTKDAISNKKLQKLAYYAYGWTLAFLNETIDDLHYRLFTNKIEAWVHGPVIPDLYQKYKKYGGDDIPQITTSNRIPFSQEEKDILDQVWDAYSGYNGNQLEFLSHKETPWIIARGDIPAYAPSSNAIKDEDIFKFFIEQQVNNS